MIKKQSLLIILSVATGATLVLVNTSLSTPKPSVYQPSPSSTSQSAYKSVRPKPSPLSTLTPNNTPPIPSPVPVSTSPSAQATPEPSPVITPTPSAHPNFTYHALPFALGSAVAATSSPWYLSKINTPAPTGNSTGPIVAVIDTGVALNHSALASRWWTNSNEMGPTTKEGPAPNCTSRGLALDKSCNNLDNDGDGYASDWRGWDFVNNDNSPQTGTISPSGAAIEHGTFVSGLIASSLTASSGGVAPSARIMALQALGDDGSGNTSTVYDAVVFAADHGAAIINLSLGSSSDDYYLHEAITYAMSKGVIVVAAAGNDGCDCMLYPANYPEVVAVGATDMNDARATFSSYGANLDLTAPGQDLCSTSWTSSNTTSYYQCGGAGTSFATPLISGTLARLLEAGVSPSLAAQFANISSDKVSAMGSSWRTDQFGTGRVNVAAALSNAAASKALPNASSIVKFSCSGTAACALTIRNSTASVDMTSKQPTGQVSGVYWDTGLSTAPSVWSIFDVNTASTLYFTTP